MTRWTGTLLLALVTGALLTGCAPDASEPTPTPSFSSDEDAFAAAEATYRAYVDALNQVDLSDPATFEPVYAWTTGEANANERKSLSQMSADGWEVEGATTIIAVAATPTPRTITACTDVSQIDVRDAEGNSVVSDSRPQFQSVQVTLEPDETSTTGLLVARIEGSDQACGG